MSGTGAAFTCYGVTGEAFYQKAADPKSNVPKSAEDPEKKSLQNI